MSSAPSAKMLVFVGDKYACVRIAGRANFNCSVDFKTLLGELLQKGFKFLILDLSECALMDSTFLGVLAGFGLRVNAPPKRIIELFNPNPRILELLENLGVLSLFRITEKAPDCSDLQAVAPSAANKEEVTRTCLEAHQTLMDIKPENEARFKDVAAFLAEDLKKLKQQG